MGFRVAVVIFFIGLATAETVSGVTGAAAADDDGLVYCPGPPGSDNSGCPVSDNAEMLHPEQQHQPSTPQGETQTPVDEALSKVEETLALVEKTETPAEDVQILMEEIQTPLEETQTPGNKGLRSTEESCESDNCVHLADKYLGSAETTTTKPTTTTPGVPQEEKLPVVRRPAQSSQEAADELVRHWNDLATWRKHTSPLSVCEEDIEQTINGYMENEFWALHMFDSWAKPGPSLLEGRSLFVGNYHQCREARAPSVGGRPGFRGNYCVLVLANMSIPNMQDILTMIALTRVQIGACMPDTCSEQNITQIVDARLQAMNLSSYLKAVATDCLSEEKEYTTFTQVAILILLVVGTLAFLGTVLDLAMQVPRTTPESSSVNVKAPDEQISSQQTDTWAKVLLSFSIYTNGKRLLSTRQAPGSVTVIPGLRFLTMLWIVFGHAYFMLVYGRASNIVQGNALVTSYRIFDSMTNMPLGVDAFFTISGFLVSYLNMKKVLDNGWQFGWKSYFLHRYWRLTPTYMAAFILVQGLQGFCVSGAMAPTMQPSDRLACEIHWWKLPLYINNLFKYDVSDMCFGHSWSVASDFQFYLLSPLMLVPFYYNRKAGIASCLTFVVVQWILTGCLSYYHNAGIGMIGNPMEYYQFCYFPFYARIAPFAIGVLVGYLLYDNSGRVTMSRRCVILGWAVTTIAGLAVLFGVHGDLSGQDRISVLAAAVYNAVSRSVWAACTCWVIVACTSGYGGPVTSFLSWSPFTVLGRLTYTGYLTQLALITIILENLEQPAYLNLASVVVYGTAGLALTCVVSAILVVTVEMPTLNLEKVLDHKKKH